MLLEFYKQGKLIKRTKDAVIGGFSWSNELMYIPTTTLTLPVLYREFLNGHDEIKIHINDKVFWGVIKKVEENKEDETVRVYLDHIVCEWEYRQISVNNAVKDKNINIVFKGANTKSDGRTSVSASDFTVLRDEIGVLTTEQYIRRAGASAWTADGGSAEITVDASKVEYRDGEWPVTFTANGVSVTVKASTKDYVDDVESTYYKMTGHDFHLTADGINLPDAEYIARAGVTIELTEEGEEKGMPLPPIQVDRKSVRARDGRYSVKYFAEYIDPEEEDPYKAIKEVSISVVCIVEGDNFAEATIADNVADIYSDMNFAHPGWRLNFDHSAGDYTIDYVYSRQNKLQALSRTLELTKDLFWRVRFVDERVIDISTFEDVKEWVLSKKPSGTRNTQLISDPKITHEYDHVVNCVTVYSEKSDTGVSSMTLREIYENPTLQEPGFPVVILRANVNNERDYRMYTEQFPKLAPNNELEYAVIDEESVALESGHLLEGTFAFNDLAPFAETVEEIDEQTHALSDDDRIKAARIAYRNAVRKLKHSRRKYQITFSCEELPAWLAVGDKIRLRYDNRLYIVEDCSAYERMVLEMDELFVVTKIKYNFNENGAEYDEITVEPEIRVDRDLMEWS